MEQEDNTNIELNQDFVNENINPDTLELQLGDIIELVSPTNEEYHETTNYVHYIDPMQIILTNVSSMKQFQLNINESGSFTDESITRVILLSRSDEQGYALQHNLLPNTWINIYFGGEVPTIITGQISNLEKDMIEIITYPKMDTIYIDFKYQGMPRDIPIDKILIREKPANFKKIGSLALMKQSMLNDEEFIDPESQAELEFTDMGESISKIPDNREEEQNIREQLNDMYVDANTIIFGEDLDAVAQLVEVPDSEKRYSIDAQVSDIMDELLSTIPNNRRTQKVLDNIHSLIRHYIHLREVHSVFDENQNISDKKMKGSSYKPLVDKLYDLNYKLNWVIPVVTNRKKININSNNEFINDVVSENMAASMHKIKEMNNKYYKKGSNDNIITYDHLMKQTQDIFRPFEKTFKDDYLINKKVNQNIDAIIDNLEDFYSTVYSESGVKRTKYVIQRYNLGTSKLQEKITNSGKKLYETVELVANDEMSVKSFMMLPAPVIKFSEINLPSSTLLSKSSLHNNYLLLFRLLRKNTNITTQVIEDFTKEVDYENIEKETNESLFDNINEFIINSDSYENIEFMDTNERFRKFLETIVPKTRTLIRLYRKYIKNRLSFIGVVQKLEPFLIYPNDVSYKQYMEIRYFINEQIKDLKTSMVSRSSDMRALSQTKYDVQKKPSSILRILSENNDFSDAFFKSYRFLEKSKLDTVLTDTEIVLNMMNTDNAELYSDIVSSILIGLNTPDNILTTIEDATIDDMGEVEKINTEDCTRRYLSKKYSSIGELQKDNNIDELYFDERYDDTPYSIMQRYENDQKKLPSDQFIPFLIENLIQRHKVPSDNAAEMAEILISKKKKILDGHYALLEIVPPLNNGLSIDKLTENEKEDLANEADIKKKIHYYRRLKNNWIRDDEIEEERFMDTNTLFCNLSSKCLKNDDNKICESNEQIRIRIKNQNQESLKSEFTKRYQISIEELERNLNTNIEMTLKKNKKNQILKEVQLYKSNNLAYELSKIAKKYDSLQSPHIELRDLIMNQEDFIKKQHNICLFVNTYCREATKNETDEDLHWYYCKDTNTKLLPISIYRLANAYLMNNYQQELEVLCNEIGTEGDDGEAIVDKHSGYVLRKKDMTTEDGFDSLGFRVQTRDIIEKDLGAIIEENKKKQVKVFENENVENLYNMLKSVCNNIDIPIESIEDEILRLSRVVIDKNILSENAYQKRSESNVKKNGKSLPAYDKYKNETTIMILAALIHIKLQTIIPSFKTNKTFPNCIRSFSGYPMTGVEDMSGINYISCIIAKMKSSIPPWDSIQNVKQDKLKIRIRDIIEKYIMPIGEIQELYVVKKEYMLLHNDQIVPEEHKIQKWKHFLPPIVKINIMNNLKNVSNEFKVDMVEKMKKGDPRQFNSLMILNHKVLQHSFGIIDAINEIVNTKDQLLKTSASVPFIENACCNDKVNLLNPIIYFNQDNPNIKLYLQRIVKISKTLSDMRTLTNARQVYHDFSTIIKYPEISQSFSEDNVYQTFIHYCNFDKDLPIPKKYQGICNSIPDGYNKKWNITEKIDFLKRNGKRFTIGQLHQLLAIVNNNNIVSTDDKPIINPVQGLKELIETLEMTNSSLFEEPLRKLLIQCINNYEPKKMKDTPSEELNNLTNYLTLANRNMFKIIMKFFDVESNTISTSHYNKLALFLMKVDKWNINENDIHTSTQFLRTAICNICKVYPIIISNNADFYKNVCEHWPYSDNHKKDIYNFISRYYKDIEKFKGDSVLMEYLKEINTKLIDLHVFIQVLPIQSEIKKTLKNEKDEDVVVSFHSLFNEHTYYELMKYCFYRMLFEFIASTDDVELLRSEIRSVKKIRAMKNNSLTDPVNFISSERVDASEIVEQLASELEENEVVSDTQDVLKSRISSLLYTFLEIEMENKDTINQDYASIMKKINRSREREKKSIIDYLGNMSKEERKVEELFKTYKLGRWNVGQQKGLVQYDKETYERERNDLLSQLHDDEHAGKYEIVSEMRREIFELDEEQERTNEAMYDNEGNDIQGLDEDYMDGHYYEEDMDLEY
jgi:hypothetical protein